MLLQVGFVILALCGTTLCYPSGAPKSACGDMIPLHGVPPQTTVAPYAISVDKEAYQPNDVINVTISGMDGTTFRGFLVEPRPTDGSNKTLGMMTPISQNMQNNCAPDAALTHTNNTDKASVSFSWKAPGQDEGPVVFVYTVVRIKKIFWVGLKSSEITFRG